MGARKAEGLFQDHIKAELLRRFPGSYIIDGAHFCQGFPDLVALLSSGEWITLECKKSSAASHRPNQDYYVNTLNDKGYSAFIYPENEKEILDDIQRTYGDKTGRGSCISRS